MVGGLCCPLPLRPCPQGKVGSLERRRTDRGQSHDSGNPERILKELRYPNQKNPDERLNADMRHAIGAKVPVRTKSELKAAAGDHMKEFAPTSKTLRVEYAA